MHLFKAKIAGHHVVKNSGWFDLHKNYTLLLGKEGTGKSTILRSLQAINPPGGQAAPNPFTDFPEYYSFRGHKRKVLPAKKTGAFAVYVCTPDLRKALTDIDPVFMETDRIEVGRRFDFSRWITFVEISSSSRWSEAAPFFEQLQKHLAAKPGTGRLLGDYAAIATLAPADRLKKDIMHKLGEWLNAASAHIDASHRTVHDKAGFIVYRAQRFQQARRLVIDHLPIHIYLAGPLLLPAHIRLEKKTDASSADLFNKTEALVNKMLGTATGLPDNNTLVEFGERLNRKMRSLYPALPVRICCGLRNKTLHFFVKERQREISLDQASPVYRWLASMSLFLLLDALKTRRALFLLDEPDDDVVDSAQLHAIMESIAEHHQLVAASSRTALVDADGLEKVRLLRMDAASSETIVTAPENLDEIE